MRFPRLRRSASACLALAATSALLLSACGTGGTGAASASEASAEGTLPELPTDTVTEIVFESYNLSGQGMWGDTIQGLIDEFNAENPHIEVTGQGVDSTNTASSVQQQVLAGNPPDVGQMTFDTMAFSAESLNAANLSAVVGTDELAEQFGGEYPYNARAKVLADIDGATYGIPYVFSTPVFWINETLLQEAGIDPTTMDISTWDSVAELAKQVTAHTGKPSLSNTCVMTGGNWCMQSMYLSNGARALSEDRSTIEFGSEAAVDTVDTFKQMYEDGILSNADVATQYEEFARGESIAFHVNTAALQATYMAGAESGGWTLNTSTLPQFGDQPSVPTNSGSALVMYSQDPAKQAAAWEFMKFMTTPEAYEAITTGIGYLPLRDTMTHEGGPLHEWTEANPLVKSNLEQLQYMEPWVAYPGDQYFEVDRIQYVAIEDSIFNGGDPATLMPETAARAQELIEE